MSFWRTEIPLERPRVQEGEEVALESYRQLQEDGQLEDLVSRGLHTKRRYPVVIDGAKSLRAGVESVLGQQAEVQRGET